MGITLNKAPREIIHGNTFDTLALAFDKIMTKGNSNPDALAAGLSELKFTTKDMFGIDAEFSIPMYSKVKDFQFYGFRAFPKHLADKSVIDLGFWENINDWHIELDHRLITDYSHHLSPQEVAMLFIYYVEHIMTDKDLNNRLKLAHASYLSSDNLDWRVLHIYKRDNPSVYQMNTMLVVYRCYWTNFVRNLSQTSVIGSYNDSKMIYISAINKLAKAYGTLQLIDRNISEFDHGALGIVKMIYESINDLKYSAHRFRKNFRCWLEALTSPFAKKCLTNLYHGFTNKVDMVFAQESSHFEGTKSFEKKTADMIAIENKNIEAYWKKTWNTLLENVDVQFLDRNGMALKCDKLEVDELRVQVANIDSTEDKIFLLEKVHKNLGIIDNALMLLSQKDKKHKVRQSETELKALRADLEMIRERIFKAPVGPTHYGLFIKYPQGYEG